MRWPRSAPSSMRTQHPDRADAQGPGRVAERPCAQPRHARHARHAAPRTWRCRNRDLLIVRRRALRRPRHRQAGRVRAATRASSTSTSTPARSASCATPMSACAATSRATLTTLTLPCAAHLHGRNGAARRHGARPASSAHASTPRATTRRATSVYAPALLKHLSENWRPAPIVACDVGQHQMWVAQHCRFADPRQHLTSGGLGAMGFGLPAAHRRAAGRAGRARVICVSGDGSFMMNVQELATLRRYRLPLKIVLLDNQALGMVRQWQELFFDKRYSRDRPLRQPRFRRGRHGVRHRRAARRPRRRRRGRAAGAAGRAGPGAAARRHRPGRQRLAAGAAQPQQRADARPGSGCRHRSA